MVNNRKKLSLFLGTALLLFALPAIAHAGLIPDNCLNNGAQACGLNDFVQLFANLYLYAVRYLGVLALLLFVYGGVVFLTSGGNTERVQQGRNILVGTTIGLLIVMGSYVIVKQVQTLIGVQSNYQINANVTGANAQCAAENGTCVTCYTTSTPKKATSCLNPNDQSDKCNFIQGLCPGDNNTMCCVPK